MNKVKKHDVKFRKWIASLPCIITGLAVDIQCAHIRFQSGAGIAQKPSDIGNCVPLHWEQHHLQHNIGEKNYWSERGGIDRVKSLAKALGSIYLNGGDKSDAVFRIFQYQRGL